MLFVIVVMIFILGIICLIAYDNTMVGEWCEGIGIAAAVTGGIGLIVTLIALICCHTGVDGYVAASQERYESLVYQYENDVYDNDNDLGKRELIKDIQSWNEDLARNQKNQNDIWIGIFIPNIYDQFEFIELDQNSLE